MACVAYFFVGGGSLDAIRRMFIGENEMQIANEKCNQVSVFPYAGRLLGMHYLGIMHNLRLLLLFLFPSLVCVCVCVSR